MGCATMENQGLSTSKLPPIGLVFNRGYFLPMSSSSGFGLVKLCISSSSGTAGRSCGSRRLSPWPGFSLVKGLFGGVIVRRSKSKLWPLSKKSSDLTGCQCPRNTGSEHSSSVCATRCWWPTHCSRCSRFQMTGSTVVVNMWEMLLKLHRGLLLFLGMQSKPLS